MLAGEYHTTDREGTPTHPHGDQYSVGLHTKDNGVYLNHREVGDTGVVSLNDDGVDDKDDDDD